MKSIIALTTLFLKMLLKEKITILFSIFTLILLTVALVFNSTEIGEKNRFFLTLLITFESNLLMFFAMLQTYNLLTKEQNLGLFILPLSVGFSRKRYLIAIFLTIFIVVNLFFLIFFLINFLLLLAFNFEVIVNIKLFLEINYQLFLYSIGSILGAFIFVTLRQFTSLTNALIYSILLFIVGNGLDELNYFFEHYLLESEKTNLAYLGLYLVNLIIPNFYTFDLLGQILNQSEISNFEFFRPLAIFIVETLVLFLIAQNRLKKKSLKTES